ncbi:hypothetical protein RSAG8_07817, partial [Rhizoctonia solani AG-8 WAC10335]
ALIVSGSDDCTIRIWKAHSMAAPMRTFVGHEKGVNAVAFSPDGSRVISGSKDHTIRLRDLSSGVTVLTLNGPSSVSSVQFTPDGAHIVSGSYDSTVRIWNTSDGSLSREPLNGHSKRVTSTAISPNGEYIVSGSLDCTVRVWDKQSGKVIAGPFEGHTGSVRSVGFSGDDMRIMSASDDKTVRVWNAQGQMPQPARASEDREFSEYECFAYSPNHTDVAFRDRYNSASFLVWDLRTMTVASVPTGGTICRLRFSLDGAHIHSIHTEGTICTWVAQTGITIFT